MDNFKNEIWNTIKYGIINQHILDLLDLALKLERMNLNSMETQYISTVSQLSCWQYGIRSDKCLLVRLTCSKIDIKSYNSN